MREYSKPNPEKAERQAQVTENTDQIIPSISTIKDAGDKYRKEEGLLKPKSFFIIVSGGEQTERKYFKIISNQDKFQRIKIEFIADPAQLNPLGLLDTARRKQEHYKSSQENEPDKFFIVSDVDDFMSELLRIKQDCEQLNISLIISNSCFEIWLYYAFYSDFPDFRIPDIKEQISRSFRRWMPSDINPVKAILNIYKNIENAKAYYKEDENNIPALLSTNMFLLAEEILPFIDMEILKIINENHQKIAKYKNISDQLK